MERFFYNRKSLEDMKKIGFSLNILSKELLR